MRPSDGDRVLYLRQLRHSLLTVLVPELTSEQAIDSAGLIDRILVQGIVEEEAAALSADFGPALEAALGPESGPGPGTAPGTASGEDHPVMTPARFETLRRRAAEVVAATAASTDPAERRHCRHLVAIEGAVIERVEELRVAEFDEGPTGDDGPAPDRCSFTAAQLTSYLRRRLAHSPEVTVEHLTLIPGGRSKETVLASLDGTGELPHEVIVRKDRPVGLLQTRAAEEYAVMAAVHDFGGVPIPEPFFAEEGEHELGEGTFVVMERVGGHRAGEFFPDLAAPTHHRRELGLHLAAALARLHSLPLDRLAGTGLDTAQASVTEASVTGMVEAIVGRIDELTGPPFAPVYLARQWLLEHVADVVPAPRVCLLQGDFGFHNMLVDGDRITALVDWEAATIGPPARELAAAWSAAGALMDTAEFLEAYVAAGGRPEDTDPRAITFYRLVLQLGGYMTSRSGGHLFRTGVKRDLLTAHSGLDSNFRCARNLSRALADALATSEPAPT